LLGKGVKRVTREWRVSKEKLRPLAPLCVIILALLASGCGKSSSSGIPREKDGVQSYIMGEVIETGKATPAEERKGARGTVNIEGSRSQEIPEALVTVTRDTRIIDEHCVNGSLTTFDSIKERQTVEVWFDVLSSSSGPWYATATKVIICP
jgi:hypothetical protein